LKIGIIAWPVDDDKKTGISFYIQNVVEQLVALGHSDDLLLVRAKQNVRCAKADREFHVLLPLWMVPE